MPSAAAPPGPPGSSLEGERLESWKEIAAYLGRTVRTVQRWERSANLPVHRLQHERQGSVYALRSELDAWWRERMAGPAPAPATVVRRERPSLRAAARAVVLAAAFATLSLPWAPPPATPPPQPQVAVLRFDDLGGGPGLDGLAAGLTEELITELSRLDGLRAFSRTSVLALGEATPSPSEVRRRLGATHLVEGSIRADGTALRVTARLVRTTDAESLWTAAESVTAGELPGLQHRLAMRVAAALLTDPPQGHGPVPARVSPEAYAAFLAGQRELRSRTASGFQAAERALLEATRRSPGFARAWAALAACHALSANYGSKPVSEARAAAEQALARALELDPELGEAWAVRAFLVRNHDWDFAEAERSFRRALELSPGDTQTWSWYALHLSTLGRFDEARAALQRTRELDPLNPAGRHQLAALSLRARRWSEAIRRLRAILQLEPEDVNARLDLGRALAGERRWEEALAELRRAVELSGEDPMAVAVLGNVLARSGRTAEARQLRDRLAELATRRHVNPYLRAVLYAGLEENAAALDQLERVVTERHVGALFMATEPELDSLRNDPRFRVLLERVRPTTPGA